MRSLASSLIAVLLVSSVMGQGEDVEPVDFSAPVLPEVEQPERDPEALPKIDEVRRKMDAEVAQFVRDIATIWDFMPKMPQELRQVVPPQNGMDATDGLVLLLHLGPDGVANVAYWGEPVDRLVGVSTNSEPGYLGEYSTNGVLRTDETIDYELVDDDSAVQLSVNPTNIASNVWSVVIENDYFGLESGITNGTYRGQVLWWDETAGDDGKWIVSDAPTAPSILVYDTADNGSGSVRWEQITASYHAAFRTTNGVIESDVPRIQ